MNALYPPLVPAAVHAVDVGAGHRLHVEETGHLIAEPGMIDALAGETDRLRSVLGWIRSSSLRASPGSGRIGTQVPPVPATALALLLCVCASSRETLQEVSRRGAATRGGSEPNAVPPIICGGTSPRVRSFPMRSKLLRWIALGVGMALAAGCDKPAGPAAAGPGAAKPVPEVAVVTAQAQAVPNTRELVGRLAATRSAQVRARVAGVLLERVYTEGTDVKPGQVLFRIDPSRLQAAVNAQEAALVRAEADAANAALTAKRFVELREKKTSSQQDLDTAQAAERTTAAAVKQARANLDAARLELGFATVTAPIAGRAGRALVTEGTLVGQGDATLLTTVDRIDPLYVNFSQSPAELADLRKPAAAGAKPVAVTQVEVLLPDGTPYPHQGVLDFSDLAVDPNTGALSLRATLPNPDRALLPGMFVTLRLTAGVLDQAFLLPQPALLRDAQGAYLLVLDDTGKVAQRRVTSRGMTRTQWIVTGDLKNGEQVIVAGLQKVKPGDQARIAPPPTPPSASAPGADKPKADAPPTAAQGSK